MGGPGLWHSCANVRVRMRNVPRKAGHIVKYWAAAMVGPKIYSLIKMEL